MGKTRRKEKNRNSYYEDYEDFVPTPSKYRNNRKNKNRELVKDIPEHHDPEEMYVSFERIGKRR